MGTEKAVLPAGSEPAKWVKGLQEAFASGRKNAELSSPDYRFVDYPYQQPANADTSRVQRSKEAPEAKANVDL